MTVPLDTEKLARVLCKLGVAPRENVKLDVVWDRQRPEVRTYYRERAILINYMLHEEDL